MIIIVNGWMIISYNVSIDCVSKVANRGVSIMDIKNTQGLRLFV
jgi:hypothetical protein